MSLKRGSLITLVLLLALSSIALADNLNCVDEDGGIKALIASNVTITTNESINIVYNDVCVDDNQLQEGYCESLNLTWEVIDCAYGCSDGRCNDLSCSDNDAGADYFFASSVDFYNNSVLYEKTDSCDDAWILNERICIGDEWGTDIHNCVTGCKDGACINNTDICTDSDAGFQISVLGTVDGLQDGVPYSNEDSCYNLYFVIENFCNATLPRSKVWPCPDGMVCKLGICVDSNISCIDSDGGSNYYEAGYVLLTNESGEYTLEDECEKSDGLLEYICSSNTVKEVAHTCSYDCKSGACVNDTRSKSCTDSDEGINLKEKGYVVGEEDGDDFFLEDSCINDSSVLERSCVEGRPQATIQDCTEGRYCDNGACIYDSVPSTCADTDGGANYEEAGTVSVTGQEVGKYNDYCNGSTLFEAYCLGEVVSWITINCSEKCENGSCFVYSVQCSDTDSGIDSEKFGAVIVSSKDSTAYQDKCEGDTLKEAYCLNNDVAWIDLTCAEGCKSGRCNEVPDVNLNLKTIYIDSKAPLDGDGSFETPINSWNLLKDNLGKINLISEKTYLVKRGSYEELNSSITANNINNFAIGSYGTGPLPILKSNGNLFDFTACSNVEISELEIQSPLMFTNVHNAKVYANKIFEGISISGLNSRIYHNIIEKSGITVGSGGPHMIFNNIFLNVKSEFVTNSSAKRIVINNIFDNTLSGKLTQDSLLNASNNLFFVKRDVVGDSYIIGDAMFVNPSAENYHLKQNSPAIDMGTHTDLTTDLEGTAIPLGAGPDIGLFEAVPPAKPTTPKSTPTTPKEPEKSKSLLGQILSWFGGLFS